MCQRRCAALCTAPLHQQHMSMASACPHVAVAILSLWLVCVFSCCLSGAFFANFYSLHCHLFGRCFVIHKARANELTAHTSVCVQCKE